MFCPWCRIQKWSKRSILSFPYIFKAIAPIDSLALAPAFALALVEVVSSRSCFFWHISNQGEGKGRGEGRGINQGKGSAFDIFSL
jgi:hypothetical protein